MAHLAENSSRRLRLGATAALTSCGDASLWAAPRRSGSGAVPVLHFTTDHGVGVAVALTRAEVARLRETADSLLRASHGHVEGWLNQAARFVNDELMH